MTKRKRIELLRDALEPNATPSGPEFLDWLADRLVLVYKEPAEIDFVQALRRKASMARSALALSAPRRKP